MSEKKSKSLSYLLRHGARDAGVAIDSQGWVSLSDATVYLNNGVSANDLVDHDDLRDLVSNNDKHRFEIDDEAGRPESFIRALHGHSMAGIEPNLEPVSSANVPYTVHGTYWSCLPAILSEGLRVMGRNKIHFLAGIPGRSAVFSGMRRSCEVVVWVDVRRAEAQGIRFVRSANGVILSSGDNGVIQPTYFHSVRDRRTGQPVASSSGISWARASLNSSGGGLSLRERAAEGHRGHDPAAGVRAAAGHRGDAPAAGIRAAGPVHRGDDPAAGVRAAGPVHRGHDQAAGVPTLKPRGRLASTQGSRRRSRSRQRRRPGAPSLDFIIPDLKTFLRNIPEDQLVLKDPEKRRIEFDLGARTVGDLLHAEVSDFAIIGIPPIPARKLLGLARKATSPPY